MAKKALDWKSCKIVRQCKICTHTAWNHVKQDMQYGASQAGSKAWCSELMRLETNCGDLGMNITNFQTEIKRVI